MTGSMSVSEDVIDIPGLGDVMGKGVEVGKSSG